MRKGSRKMLPEREPGEEMKDEKVFYQDKGSYSDAQGMSFQRRQGQRGTHPPERRGIARETEEKPSISAPLLQSANRNLGGRGAVRKRGKAAGLPPRHGKSSRVTLWNPVIRSVSYIHQSAFTAPGLSPSC